MNLASYWPTTDWRSAAPAMLRMNAEKLSALDALIRTEYSNITGMVVVRNGYIAYERYDHGYRPEDPQHVASVTKSVMSALIGIAIDAGYITSVDQKVLDFFPEYVLGTADDLKRDITIRHLLTMTAPYSFADWHEPLDKMCIQSDWVTYALDLLDPKGRIGAYKYSTAGAHLLSCIITRSTGQSARAFANERLFKPIGMREIPDYGMTSYEFEDLFGSRVRGWVSDPEHHSTGGWGLTLTPRDMARFGLLYLNRGRWDNVQVIQESWIDQSIALTPDRYGYLWWLSEEEGLGAYCAIGDGGNIICCVPDKKLVVAIASSFIVNPRDRWTLIKEHILPAMIE
ncbi:serine hydrolase domain-containing protein [Paenibacillus guangzhouensis]|uniref:serine hydrolase domain-containing protein n=1 Tax=Paenibacillus guangzhouensis TaxID=1473112 RepID=UPI001266DE22|nr:serine hydrolase [Paenibacillus guangzhouensis]